MHLIKQKNGARFLKIKSSTEEPGFGLERFIAICVNHLEYELGEGGFLEKTRFVRAS